MLDVTSFGLGFVAGGLRLHYGLRKHLDCETGNDQGDASERKLVLRTDGKDTSAPNTGAASGNHDDLSGHTNTSGVRSRLSNGST